MAPFFHFSSISVIADAATRVEGRSDAVASGCEVTQHLKEAARPEALTCRPIGE